MENFPPYSRDYEDSKNVSVRLFGNRFLSDQTLYEYLIEFLLIFSTQKQQQPQLAMHFHTDDSVQKGETLSFQFNPRMGLKRFIFFDKSRKNSSKIDKAAYVQMIELLKKSIDGNVDADEFIGAIQDLLYGNAVVVKKRTWSAQALLPICKNLVFCEAMPKTKKRNSLFYSKGNIVVDTGFDFDKRDFLARGGELYYLTILYAIQNNQEKRAKLEALLQDLLVNQCQKINQITDYIQNIWQSYQGFSDEALKQSLNLSSLPIGGYEECPKQNADELIRYLSCAMDPVKRVELLGEGMVFQIMRMLHTRVYTYLSKPAKPWLIDMNADGSDVVKKCCASGFTSIENDFMSAINDVVDVLISEGKKEEKDSLKLIREGRKNSWDIFKAKGKELQCIIPANGKYERMSLAEDIITFLVMTLLECGEKITFDEFLSRMYDSYNIVIGPVEYIKAMRKINHLDDIKLASAFYGNRDAFQQYLASAGFLKELSDATSLVINPYRAVKLEADHELH